MHRHPSVSSVAARCLFCATAISNRSSVRAVCGVCTSGSQPSPTGALSVQSAVFAPPAHSHLQPELCPCSLRCLHLRLTAISNRSSVRAVCGVCTSGSQPSPTGALSVQSAVFAPPAHSHLQPELCPCSLRCLHLRLTAISNRSSVRAVCGVCTSGSQPSPTGALSVQSAVYAPPAHSHLQPELCPCSLRCMHLRLTAISNRSSVRAVCGVCTSGSQPSPTGALSVQSAVFAPPAHSHLQPELCPCSLRCLHLRLTAISNRSSVRAVCGVCASGSQPSPTGALSVQSAVFAPPAHSHLQPELCPCSLRCMHLRLTAISNRNSVRAVCGVCTSGSQPSPTGTLSVQSAVYAPPAHSHLQPELCPCSLWSTLCYDWLMTGGPDDVSELPDLVRAHRGVSVQSSI